MKYPLVSIIIPAYNAEKYIAEAISSALDQTWPNKEIIVIDDGSTDNSLAVAETFAADNVKIFHQENKGASAARNKGLSEAKGEYIQFLDADDLLGPNKIEAQIEQLVNKADYLSFGKTVYFNDKNDNHFVTNNDPWYENSFDNPIDFLLKLYTGDEITPGFGGMIPIHAWLTPKNLIANAGGWNEDLSVDDDGEFFCRVILKSKGISFCEAGACYYRKYDAINMSLSSGKSRENFESRLAAVNLKYSALKEKTDSPLLDRIFAGHYWEIGVDTYPQFKDLSDTAIRLGKIMGYRGSKYKSGKLSTALSKLLGWRIVRSVSYHKHGF